MLASKGCSLRAAGMFCACCVQVDHDDAAARVGMAWHPNGMLLAVAGEVMGCGS
jgi:hypothetical protein